VLRIQQVEGEFRVVVPAEAMEALRLSVGAAVRVIPEAEPERSRYVGVEEGMKAYFETEPLYRESYQELAK